MEVKSDEHCLVLLKEGNEDIYRYLIRVYGPVLCSYVEKIVFDRAAAEDIVEDIFVKLWEKHTVFDSLLGVRKFLYMAARNASLNFKRSKEREKTKHDAFSRLSTETISIDEIIYAELMAEVRSAIDSLPHKMRKIFIMGYIDQLSNQEIAAQLDLSCQTVRNQKTKALTIIRGLLKGHPGDRIILYITLLLAIRGKL
ncbi:RNA polymerase sigma-70 factor [Chitinophaga sp. 22321]|uniref:RNA polymerase sigma-70 factor n=1 Tax=Chitinophaga hostae TaxID=2831022 RepID=A0ABS5J8F4_9BACT|nr:RNA polymerase sigma-70 factor [Chitinophaga hostae]MBS0030857.1 RNA polymerase sigma-70 factor [Chitinophaga hostae]